MPIFRSADKVFYFAHVPRCGGTSVEDGIAAAGAPLSFLDRKHHARRSAVWTKTSPQHALARDIEPLFAEGFVDHSFAVMRDPVARFVSAFNFNRDNELIDAGTSVDDFAAELARRGDGFAGAFDNHFVPASEIAPANARLFRLEDGLAAVGAWLTDVTVGALAPTFGSKNARSFSLKAYERRAKRAVGLSARVEPVAASDLSEGALSHIRRVYASDDERLAKLAAGTR